jgi:hypothetical protein
MRRHLRAAVIASAVVLAALGAGPAWAQTTSCQLAPVFVMLRDQVGRDRVGECTGPMVRNEAGDMTQQTTRGILTLRSTDQVVAFSDGQMTWLFGPNGLESRPSGSRLAWESVGTGRSNGGPSTGSATATAPATPTPSYATPTSAYGTTTPSYGSTTPSYGSTTPSYGSTAYASGSTGTTANAYATPTVYPASYSTGGTATTSSTGTSPTGLLDLPPAAGAPGNVGTASDGVLGLSPTPSPSPMVPLKDELPLSISGSDASSSKPFNLAGGDYPVRWDVSLQHGKSGCYVGARLRRFDEQNPGALVMHTTLGSTKDRSSGGDTRLFSVAPGRYVLDVATTGCSWKLTIQTP